MFDYFSKNAEMIDYKDEEQRMYIGCFCIIDKDNILKDIHLNIPYIYDEITMLISIHEIIHGIILYKKLNKKYKHDNTIESLSLLYEKIYMEETESKTLNSYQQELNSKINQENPNHKEYILALTIREELYQKYNYDIKEMQKLSKKLIRKYNKQVKYLTIKQKS